MDEDKAKEILGDAIKGSNHLYDLGWYLYWDKNEEDATLDGDFTADDLEAIAWWMRNKK